MEWLLVIPVGVSIVIVGSMWRRMNRLRDGYVATNVKDAYTVGFGGGAAFGIASVLTIGMVFDLLVRAVKALVN